MAPSGGGRARDEAIGAVGADATGADDADGHAGQPVGVKAFIDVGTNSVRLLLVRIAADGGTTELTERKETVRLGEGEFGSGLMTPTAMERATLVVRTFAEMARANGANEIIAIATAATREARNREVFLTALREAAGLEVRPISGPEEARLIYLGVASGLHLGDQKALFVDIGGGSTELIVGDQRAHLALESLPLGAIRLTNQFFAAGDDGPVSPEHYAHIQTHVRLVAVRALQRMQSFGPVDVAIGSSGTAQNLADIAMRLTFDRNRERTDVLTAEQLGHVARRLCDLPLAERAKMPGINPVRADIIVAGAAILETIMAELGLAELVITYRGLREGLIVDFLDRHHPGVRDGLTVREHSVLQLGRRCQFDEAHHVHVARLALMLYDSARACGLLEAPEPPRELLQHAAMLHDIGAFLSYAGHERHTYYLVRHAPLLGFDEREVQILAAVARFHRKGYPSKRRAEYRDLPGESRRIVRPLVMLLRLAEELDRTHTAQVRDARFTRGADGTLRLEVVGQGDWQLERWGVEGELEAFEDLFGVRPVVVSGAGVGAAATTPGAANGD